MKRIGVISDTHGTFDDCLKLFLKDVDEIWHAGDIGSLECANEIAQFKPLRAVFGNIDNTSVRYNYSEFSCFECEGIKVLMTHIGGYPRHYQPKALQDATDSIMSAPPSALPSTDLTSAIWRSAIGTATKRLRGKQNCFFGYAVPPRIARFF